MGFDYAFLLRYHFFFHLRKLNLKTSTMYNIRQYFLLPSLFILLGTLSSAALAKDPSLNETIIKQIEDTLLFNKEARDEIGFEPKKKKVKKSDIVIDRTVDNFADSNGAVPKTTSVSIKVNDNEIKNIEVRKKERMAYNASVSKQYEAAIALYKDVLASEPNNSYAKYSLAILYQKIGQLSQAKEIYYKILKDEPENKEQIISNILAIMIEEAPRDAIYILSRLMKQSPESSYIYAQSALAYDKVEDYDNAIRMIKRAIILEPSKVDYKYNLAVIYDKQGQYREALNTYSETLKQLDVKNENHIGYINQIESRMESIKSIL